MMHKTITVFGKQIPVWALAAAAGALGLVLVMRARSKGTSVVSAGTTAAAAAAAQSASAATIYDPNLQGLVSAGNSYAGTADYGSQLAAIQAELSALSNPPPPAMPPADTGPVYTDLSTEVRLGTGGYWQTGAEAGQGGTIDTAAGHFSWVPSIPMADALTASGSSLFWQPTPGNFLPWTRAVNAQVGNVPVYTQVPYAIGHPPAGAAATAQTTAHA